jgi:hypothetical protein
MKTFKRTRMLLRIALLGIAILALSNFTHAQVQHEDLVIAQSLFTKSKKAIISTSLKMDNNPESLPFWKLYDQYEFKRKAIVLQRVRLLQEYLDKYFVMDDLTASRLTSLLIKSEERLYSLDKKYFKSFTKLIGGVQATKLFQIEMYIQTAMLAEFQTQIPILGEMENIKVQLTEQSKFLN